MRHISTYRQPNESAPPKAEAESSTPRIKPADLDWLWGELAELYGATLLREHGERPPKRWQLALEGLSREHLEFGLHQLQREGRDWPPSAPGFRRRCIPGADVMGLPSEDEAYRQAAMRDWRHPEVWAAAEQVGVWELANRPEYETRPVFVKAYRKVLERRAMGQVFEFPRQRRAIAHQPKVDGPTNHRDAMAAMRRRLKGQDPEGAA